MTVNSKQIEAVTNLPPPERYSHFIKKVVGWGELWALYDAGWAMLETDEGQPVFPLWPEKEYADLCVLGAWKNCRPKTIELNEVLDSLIPMLRERQILPGVFYTIGQGSVEASVDELERDLREELSKYE